MTTTSAMTSAKTVGVRCAGGFLRDGGTLADRRPNIHESLQRRREPLRVLHRRQISLLREWRHARLLEEPSHASSLLAQLLLTVNAIASGLGATG